MNYSHFFHNEQKFECSFKISPKQIIFDGYEYDQSLVLHILFKLESDQH